MPSSSPWTSILLITVASKYRVDSGPSTALYPPLADVIMDLKRKGMNVLFIPKAMTRQKDAYSAFHDAVPDLLMNAMRVDIAGLAGDYCVKSTIEDLRRLLHITEIRTIDQGIAWIGEPQPLL